MTDHLIAVVVAVVAVVAATNGQVEESLLTVCGVMVVEDFPRKADDQDTLGKMNILNHMISSHVKEKTFPKFLSPSCLLFQYADTEYIQSLVYSFFDLFTFPFNSNNGRMREKHTFPKLFFTSSYIDGGL